MAKFKTSFVFVLVLMFASRISYAQHDRHYLFADFKPAIIYFKTGLQQKADLNYNTLTQEMVFKKGTNFLAIANIESIDSIFFDQQKFIPVNGIFYEFLGGKKYSLFIQYKSKLIATGKSTGFGTSQTTAVDNLSNVFSSGKVYELEIDKDYKVFPCNFNWILMDGHYQQMNSLKEAARLFPGKDLKSYVKINKIKFDSPQDVLKMVLHLDQIK